MSKEFITDEFVDWLKSEEGDEAMELATYSVLLSLIKDGKGHMCDCSSCIVNILLSAYERDNNSTN